MLKLNSLFLSVILLVYLLGLIIVKIGFISTGIMDVMIMSLIVLGLLIKPSKFVNGSYTFLRESFGKAILLLLLYYVALIPRSHNSYGYIVLEFMSVFKWLLYLYLGYVFNKVYPSFHVNFPNRKLVLIISFIICVFSLITYNWFGLKFDLGSLFGFYDIRIPSLFQLPSIFSLFGIMMFFYALNYMRTSQVDGSVLLSFSALFIFMAGSRKALIAIFIMMLFFRNSYLGANLKRLRLFFMIVVIVLISFSSLVSDSIREYSNPLQPRNVAMAVSFKIAYDNFPLGSGPCTIFSKGSMENYSPLYSQYGISEYWGFSERDYANGDTFINDTYWAQIIGQYGVIGVFLILLIVIRIRKKVMKLPDESYIGWSVMLGICLYLSLTTPALQRTEIALLFFFPLGIYISQIGGLENISNKNASDKLK